jgi:hypothetical protein
LFSYPKPGPEDGQTSRKKLAWTKNGPAHEFTLVYARPVKKSDVFRPFPVVYGLEEILYPDHLDQK